MATTSTTALSIVHSFLLYTKNNNTSSIHYYSHRSNSRTTTSPPHHHPHGSTTISCIMREQDPEKKKDADDQGKKKQLLFTKINMGLEKLGRELKESLSPKQKGDWKDVMLMSLSFAVLVYISQKIVCAYCVWNSINKTSW